jgi:hypothetical protein
MTRSKRPPSITRHEAHRTLRVADKCHDTPHKPTTREQTAGRGGQTAGGGRSIRKKRGITSAQPHSRERLPWGALSRAAARPAPQERETVVAARTGRETGGMTLKLRQHQVQAVDAIVRGLDIPAGGRIPTDGLRGQVIAACGTSKTAIAAASARRIAPKGRVLVLMPTLDLLTQTVNAWREAGRTGPAVAACSLQNDPELQSMQVRSTTNPTQLALWHGTGPVTIYATYASLGVLAEAFGCG